jgi:hypothetical protein
MNWNRKNKDLIREFVLPDHEIKYGIWLPANSCLCVNKAEKAGLLKNAKRIFLVEKNYEIFQQMSINAPKLPSVKLIHNKIENLCFRFEKRKGFDYAYLDFLGGVTLDICWWLTFNFSSCIVPNATIAITQSYSLRNNNIIKSQRKLLKETEGIIIREHFGLSLPVDEQLRLILIYRLFNWWDFNVCMDEDDCLPKYQDSQNSMIILKLTNFQPRKIPLFRPLEFPLPTT